MRSQGTSKPNRIAAGIMVCMMLVTVLFSAFFLAAEAGHHCEDDDCPICACMQQCENALHGMGLAVLSCAVLLPLFLIFLSFLFSACPLLPDTPVSRKVRLNN